MMLQTGKEYENSDMIMYGFTLKLYLCRTALIN